MSFTFDEREVKPSRVTYFLYFSFFLSSLCWGDPLWWSYLRSQGRDTYYQDEYRAYVGQHVGEYVDSIYDDVAELGKWVVKNYDPSQYHYLDIGSGPLPVATYLKNLA